MSSEASEGSTSSDGGEVSGLPLADLNDVEDPVANDDDDDDEAIHIDLSSSSSPLEESQASPVLPLVLHRHKLDDGGRESRPRRSRLPAAAPTRSSAKLSAPTPLATAQLVFERRLDEAKYECNVDAYRGMCAETLPAWNASPWVQSCCAFQDVSSQSTATGEDALLLLTNNNDEFDKAVGMVRYVSDTSCPSLVQWTLEAQKKAAVKRKRKRKTSSASEDDTVAIIGLRPSDPSFTCECDFNPFCLASLGGIVNELLQEKAKSLQQAGRLASTGVDDDTNDGSVEEEASRHPLVQFSPGTLTRLNTLRKSVWIDKNNIQLYLQPLLEGIMPINSMMKVLSEVHKELMFINPVDESLSSSNDVNEFHMSIPPGISNLGATCYLNTQLQCLAQNLVFTKGIFQWRPPRNGQDRMSSVLSSFQKLLAELREGGNNTCCALEWTTALGLDHGEQQDPNEFSRLLFARMSESFQAHAQQQKQDGQNNLATLLSDLFQGEIVYETQCTSCGNISSRKEDFEDLNLPIVKPPRKSKHEGLLALFSSIKDMDTDVQYCLERSCCDELLEGDNQYFCCVCDQKQDATRRAKFQKLPPCLNVQLSRYIYDRTKGEKKKLTEKVLLPTSLNVELSSHGTVQDTRYVLCAVMRHKGNSAYHGHYVAEAMDWLSGQWFEFNDETVALLENGPTCSYDPEDITEEYEASAETKSSSKKLAGSNDAYNMYYVEESFLSQSVTDHARALVSSVPDPDPEPVVENRTALDHVRSDRKEKYLSMAT
jgi:ubiquitin C-terminal hydrolase